MIAVTVFEQTLCMGRWNTERVSFIVGGGLDSLGTSQFTMRYYNILSYTNLFQWRNQASRPSQRRAIGRSIITYNRKNIFKNYFQHM